MRAKRRKKGKEKKDKRKRERWKKKKPQRGVPPEMAQKLIFFTENVTRNREASTREKKKKKEKSKKGKMVLKKRTKRKKGKSEKRKVKLMNALALWWVSHLSLVSSLFMTVLLIIVSLPQNQFSRSALASGPTFSLGNSPHSATVWPSPGEKGEPPCGSQGRSPDSLGNDHIQKRHSAPKKTTHSRATLQHSLGKSAHS